MHIAQQIVKFIFSWPVAVIFLVLFKDDEMAIEILKSHDPKEQKAMGRNVKNFDPKESSTANSENIVP